jgi:molybdenum cofactor cytidylyltransferase
MRLDRLTLADAEGAVLLHTYRLPSGTIKKGQRLSRPDLEALRCAGIDAVFAACLEPGDVGEDQVAGRIGTALAGPGVALGMPSKGRCNLFARHAGVLLYDRAVLSAANATEPALNIISLHPGEYAPAGQLVAQIKVIPYAVAESAVDKMLAVAAAAGPLFEVAPLVISRCALLQTGLPGAREELRAKMREVLARKLAAWGAEISAERYAAHEPEAIASALTELEAGGAQLILVAGAAATTDERDVVPLAIARTGGSTVQLGVPVEPGTLLGLAHTQRGVPVLILPGSLRSSLLSSFDVVAPRLLAGRRLSRSDLRALGAGGLLKAQTKERANGRVPQAEAESRVGAIVLAAGRSLRMARCNKLLMEVAGKPVIRCVVDALAATGIDPIAVVTGYESDRLRAALAELPVDIVENPDYSQGMSSSLRAGLNALEESVSDALICLGDMPWVEPGDLRRIIAAGEEPGGRRICVPVHHGRRGNPVLWARSFFPALKLLRGDRGAKDLMAAYADAVVEVESATDGVLRDVDTVADLREVTE